MTVYTVVCWQLDYQSKRLASSKSLSSPTIPTDQNEGNLSSTHKIELPLNSVGHFVNGVLSNCAMIASTQPLFTLKTYLMAKKGLPPMNRLYSGLVVNCAGGAPAEGVAFLTQHAVSKLLHVSTRQQTDLERVAISSASGAVGGPINAIAERIMTQQQLKGLSLASAIQCIYSSGGLKSFFRGTTPTAGRDSLFNSAIFALNDIAQERLTPHISNKKIREISASALVGSLAGFISTPFDLIRTRMQENLHINCDSMILTAQKIAKKEGPRALFCGGAVRAILIGTMICVATQAKETFPRYFPAVFSQESSKEAASTLPQTDR